MMIDPYSLEGRFFDRFKCWLGVDYLVDIYDRIYIDEREYIKKGRQDESLIVYYDASNLKGNLDDLMQRSLDTGVNLIFEQVKDKKVIITDEMEKKAWDEGRIIFI